MTSHQNKDALDQALSESLGANEAKPDFDKFFHDHKGAVESLGVQTDPGQSFDDLIARFFGRLAHMFRLMRVPAGLCLLLVFIGIWSYGPYGNSVAWAEVGQKMEMVQQVQFYKFAFKNGVPRGTKPSDFTKGTYRYGQIESFYADGTRLIDDGQKSQVLDSEGGILAERESEYEGITRIDNMNSLFEVLTKGLLQCQQSQVDHPKPVEIGDDFLVYSFLPSGSFESWLDSIVITVERNSLLPIQMKFYYNEEGYPGREDIYFFEYTTN